MRLVDFIIRTDDFTWLNCPTLETSEGPLWTCKERYFRTRNSSENVSFSWRSDEISLS